MKSAIFKQSAAFYAALAVFLASSAGSLAAYGAIQRRDRARDYIFDHLPEGGHAYAVTGQGRCVGGFTASLKPEGDTLAFSAEGEVHAVYAGSLIPVQIGFKAFFNSLNQLIGSYLRVTAPRTEIGLGTLGIHPITAVLKARIDDAKYRYSTTLPGPVELQKNTDGSYRVSYPLLRGFNRAALGSRAQSWLAGIDLKITPAESGPPCGGDNSAGIDMTQTVDLLQRAFGGLGGIIGAVAPSPHSTGASS